MRAPRVVGTHLPMREVRPGRYVCRVCGRGLEHGSNTHRTVCHACQRWDAPADQGWRDHAACAGTDPEAFFPDPGGRPAAAKRVCGGCPVVAECLAYALAVRPMGVWGGTTEKERARMVRSAKRRAS